APRGRGARARGRSPELLLQPRERPVRPRLHGSAGDAERGGGLLLREVEEVAAGEHVAVVVAEALDRGQEPLPALSRDRGLLRLLARPAGLRRRAQRQPGAAAPRTPAVAGLVRDDREQPRAERLPAAKASQPPVRLHEPVLCGLLRVAGVPD